MGTHSFNIEPQINCALLHYCSFSPISSSVLIYLHPVLQFSLYCLFPHTKEIFKGRKSRTPSTCMLDYLYKEAVKWNESSTGSDPSAEKDFEAGKHILYWILSTSQDRYLVTTPKVSSSLYISNNSHLKAFSGSQTDRLATTRSTNSHQR